MVVFALHCATDHSEGVVLATEKTPWL